MSERSKPTRPRPAAKPATTRLPRLERLLLDEDIDLLEVRPLLESLGFTTKSVLEVQRPRLTDDVKALAYARRYGWILVCHDKHVPPRKRKYTSTSGKPTPEAWFEQLANKGGRVIEIEGGNQQPAMEAVGKLIMWREDWRAFFAKESGAVLVHRNGRRLKRKADLEKELGSELSLRHQFPEQPKKQTVSKPRRPRPIPGAELTPRMPEGSGDE